MKLSIILLSLFLISPFAITLLGQEALDVDAKAIDTALKEKVQSGQEEWLSSLMLVQFDNNLLVSKDGQYAAQNNEELQTYYDMAMGYQYIESPQIREQLQLEQEEGIIIESVEKLGEGYRIGFRPSDLVLRVDDVRVDTQYDLVIALKERRGKTAVARVRRDGKETELAFSLSKVQIEQQMHWIIGVSVDEMSDLLRHHLRCRGVAITHVSEKGPAEKMGLRVHDVISKIGGIEVEDTKQLRTTVQASEGKTLRLELVRAGNKMTIDVTPEHRDLAQGAEVAQVPLLAQLPLVARTTWPQLSLQPRVAIEPITKELLLQIQPRLLARDILDSQPTGEPQARLEKIQASLEELQSQVEALRESIDKQ